MSTRLEEGEASATEERLCAAAMRKVRAAVPRYAWISREPILKGEPTVAPERFCDELLDALFSDSALDPERFFAWVLPRQSWIALFHVLASRHACRLDRSEDAASYAEGAVALDPRDLYAQRLAMQATPEGASELAATEAWLKERFCARPFEVLETRSNGNAHMCCDAWMPAATGRIDAGSADAVWNTPAAQEIRRSILDGDYRYCSRMFCPSIASRRLRHRDEVGNPEHRAILRERRTLMGRGPSRVLLSHDRSCNLSCPSCRQETILAGKTEQDRLLRLADEVLLPLMHDARIVKVTGSGDPFASHHFRQILLQLSRTRAPDLKVEIHTNGQLLDARAWEELGLEGLVDSIWISIDAARPATYEQLRRGGSHARLLRNLDFVAGLRRAARFRFFRLDTVVQAANLEELPEIVAVARQLGADLASFQRLRNWGTFGLAEFAALDVASPGHPRHADLLAVLAQPCFQGPTVDLGNLRPLLTRSVSAVT